MTGAKQGDFGNQAKAGSQAISSTLVPAENSVQRGGRSTLASTLRLVKSLKELSMLPEKVRPPAHTTTTPEARTR